MNLRYQKLYLAFISLSFIGCANTLPSLEQRYAKVIDMVKQESLTQVPIATKQFTLFSLQPSVTCKDSVMHVYIEGDGLAWKTRTLISDDPTPLTPIALSLMQHDSTSCKVYIARPCQYIHTAKCEEKYWTSHRFSLEVIESFDEALENLKQSHGVNSFHLVGYSGGGAVAALLAARRSDVTRLVTIAGNLDITYWSSYHHIDPLRGSLNPKEYASKLQHISQHHMIGTQDSIIPKEVFFSYQDSFQNQENITYSLHKASHMSCWDGVYKLFMK